MTKLGGYAFHYVRNLTTIIIPNSVTSIEWYAFKGCCSLTSVTFENTSGWFVSTSSTATSGTNIDVTNPSTNANYLKNTYNNYYWKKK